MTTDLPRCGEVVGFDSDAHTITLRVETMPDGLAIGDRLHGPHPALSAEDAEALRAIEPYLSEDYDAGCITTAYRDAIDRYRAALGRVLAGATARPRPAPEVVETLARMAKQADAMGFDKQAGALRDAARCARCCGHTGWVVVGPGDHASILWRDDAATLGEVRP